MKRNAFCFLALWIVALFLQSSLLMAQTVKNDDYGKVIGQLIDPETGKPVKEVFRVCIFDWNYRKYDYFDKKDCNYRTDKNGTVTFNFPPGHFGILFWPVSPDSKYAINLHPFFKPMPEEYREKASCSIIVERGKITRFVKHVIIGGKIKLNLVDLAGNPIEPAVAFAGQRYDIIGDFINYKLGPITLRTFKLKTGQLTTGRFIPNSDWEMVLRYRLLPYHRDTRRSL